MHKDITSLKKANLERVNTTNLQPQKETLQKILQFAAAYRVEVVPDKLKIEVFLN